MTAAGGYSVEGERNGFVGEDRGSGPSGAKLQRLSAALCRGFSANGQAADGATPC